MSMKANSLVILAAAAGTALFATDAKAGGKQPCPCDSNGNSINLTSNPNQQSYQNNNQESWQTVNSNAKSSATGGAAKSNATGGAATATVGSLSTGPSTSKASTGAITNTDTTGASTSTATNTATTGNQTLKTGNTTYNTKVAAFTPNVEGGRTGDIFAVPCVNVTQKTGWGLNVGLTPVGVGLSSPGNGSALTDEGCLTKQGEIAKDLQHMINRGNIATSAVGSADLPCVAKILMGSKGGVDLDADDKAAALAACGAASTRVVYLPTPIAPHHYTKNLPGPARPACPTGQVLKQECEAAPKASLQ